MSQGVVVLMGKCPKVWLSWWVIGRGVVVLFMTCMQAPWWGNPWEFPVENMAKIPIGLIVKYTYYSEHAY